VIRGERPIKLGGSWFFAKSIEVERSMRLDLGVENSMCAGGF